MDQTNQTTQNIAELQAQMQAYKDNQQSGLSSCPNCGYCPHCGRGPYRAYPNYPYYPHYPYWQTNISGAIGGLTSTQSPQTVTYTSQISGPKEYK